MREARHAHGLMSGDGKRSAGHRPQATAPILDFTSPCGLPESMSENSITLTVPRSLSYRHKMTTGRNRYRDSPLRGVPC